MLRIAKNAYLARNLKRIQNHGRNGLAPFRDIAAAVIFLFGIAPLGIGNGGLAAAVANSQEIVPI